MSRFEVDDDQFLLDGQRMRILAGAMHYFRVVPEYWEDRLLKLKACGLNTVETYVPWNMHEPHPGEFCFAGMLDIERFISLAAELDLLVIVRPGPYICSEWDLGGLPSWLLAVPGMRLRCANDPYLEAVDRYYDELIPRLAALQITHSGPVIAMQIENEYGSYGNDKQYLRHLADGLRRRGVDVSLFTSDGPTNWMLQGGTLSDILKAVNFGSNAIQAFAKLREHQPQGPLLCGEFWDGWFDHWGEDHHTRDPQETAQALDEVLAAGGSFNLYMFHGGTTFGFMSGANHAEHYQSDVNSYDWDAPLSEAGDPTPKYYAIREVIGRYAPLPDLPVPDPTAKANFGEVELIEQARLFDVLDEISRPVQRVSPEPMEMLGQSYGFILYRTMVTGPREEAPLVIQDVHDRALVFVDGEYRGVIDRYPPGSSLSLAFGPGDYQLDILVENMGRVNYGPFLADRKGITEGVRLERQFLYHWRIFPLPLKDLSGVGFAPGNSQQGPIFCRGVFEVESVADTFLALPGWTKGVCFLNGFNLGRYWEVGPQRTLYIPAPLLRKGPNELIVFELYGMLRPVVELRDKPDLGL